MKTFNSSDFEHLPTLLLHFVPSTNIPLNHQHHHAIWSFSFFILSFNNISSWSLNFLFHAWMTKVATCNSSWRTLTYTTAFCLGPSCRNGCGSHSPASAKHGCATTLEDFFSTSCPGSCGASIFIIGRRTSMSLKVNLITCMWFNYQIDIFHKLLHILNSNC